jgi:hypothetical protein
MIKTSNMPSRFGWIMYKQITSKFRPVHLHKPTSNFTERRTLTSVANVATFQLKIDENEIFRLPKVILVAVCYLIINLNRFRVKRDRTKR